MVSVARRAAVDVRSLRRKLGLSPIGIRRAVRVRAGDGPKTGNRAARNGRTSAHPPGGNYAPSGRCRGRIAQGELKSGIANHLRKGWSGWPEISVCPSNRKSRPALTTMSTPGSRRKAGDTSAGPMRSCAGRQAEPAPHPTHRNHHNNHKSPHSSRFHSACWSAMGLPGMSGRRINPCPRRWRRFRCCLMS